MTGQSNRLKSALLMAAAGLCWSTGGILVRSVAVTNAWEVAFWRALFMTLFIGMVLTVQYRQQAVTRIVAVGLPGLLAGMFLSLCSFLFILSVMRTTVANALILMSTTPFVAALFGRWFLGERVLRHTYLAMTAGLAGVSLMFMDATGSGALSGNLLACGVPLAFGANIMLLRRMGATVDMVPAVLLAGLIAVTVALPLSWPVTASWHDISVLAVMGVFQLGLGCLLMTLAAPQLSAAEIGLLSLLETTLGPVWVWIGIGEQPSDPALLGGVIVISSLVMNEMARLPRRRLITSPVEEHPL
ncbi:MAG: DMT family transporter [Candidatus Binatia bacterium]